MGAVNEAEPIDDKRRKRGVEFALNCLTPMLLLAVCGVVTWLLVVWIASLFDPSQPPPSAENPPLVADARNVVVHGIGMLEQNSITQNKFVTYETALDPDAVYKFYEEALVRDGWGGKGFFSKPEVTTEGMTFEWEQTGIDGFEGVAYTLEVVANKAAGNSTHVQLKVARCQTPSCQ